MNIHRFVELERERETNDEEQRSNVRLESTFPCSARWRFVSYSQLYLFSFFLRSSFFFIDIYIENISNNLQFSELELVSDHACTQAAGARRTREREKKKKKKKRRAGARTDSVS